MLHIMLDIETLGTEHDATILSIGAVKFEPMKPGSDIDSFYVTINPASCLTHKMSVSGDTIRWWLDPERSMARKELLSQPMVDLWDALDGFSTWFGPDSMPVWGNGATFDNVIVRSAFDRVGILCPWKFYHDRCYRTLKSMALHVDIKREGTHHNALDDAVSQARHLQAIVDSLELVV